MSVGSKRCFEIEDVEVNIWILRSFWCFSLFACAPLKFGTVSSSGSVEQGRYNPSNVLTNPKVPACWANDGGESLNVSSLSYLKPFLEFKIWEQVVARSEGVVNPFPANTSMSNAIESAAKLPSCDQVVGPRIKMYLAGYSSEVTEQAALANNKPEAGVGGLFYRSCERIEKLPPGRSVNDTVLAGGGNLNVTAIPAGFESDQRCVVVFVSFLNHLVSRNTETLKAYSASTLLHELLHAYGFDEEHLHGQNIKMVEEKSNDSSVCDAKKRFGLNTRPQSYGVDFNNYDSKSIMNYCFSNHLRFEDVTLSEGDVSLLKFLYPNTQNSANNTNNTNNEPQPTPSQTSPTEETARTDSPRQSESN
jgi:hypothetical protein